MLIPKNQKVRRIKPKRLSDKAHLKYVSGFPCACCGAKPVEVHHLIGKYENGPIRGWGLKAGDNFTIPLCPAHHRGLHDISGNEIEFLEQYGVDGMEIAKQMWEASHE